MELILFNIFLDSSAEFQKSGSIVFFSSSGKSLLSSVIPRASSKFFIFDFNSSKSSFISSNCKILNHTP